MNRIIASGISILLAFLGGCTPKSGIDDFTVVSPAENPGVGAISNNFQFNGFTEYWHDVYEQRLRYGNLFRINVPDAESYILQSKINIAEELGISGLQLEEGFISGLLSQPYTLIEDTTQTEIEKAVIPGKNALLLTTKDSDAGKKLFTKYTESNIAKKLNSHQYYAEGYSITPAFILSKNNSKLHCVIAPDKKKLDRFKTLLTEVKNVLNDYDMKKGWFGTQTLIKSVTCTPGTPIEVMGKGMNEGNSWFVFDGYMEFLAQNEINNWIREVNAPVVADVGFSPMYGLENYKDLQVQSMFTPESWINYAKEKKGYVFRSVFDTGAERLKLNYDGYFASEGNMEQLNKEDKPFVASTGPLKGGAVTSMVLFTPKTKPFTKATLWEAIMSKREVAVLDQGKMIGPDLYRNTLQLLLLDRVFLEEYFGDRIDLNAIAANNKVSVQVSNLYSHAVEGKLKITLPKHITLSGDSIATVSLPANTAKNIEFNIIPSSETMGQPNPIAIQYDWGTSSKSTLALLELPPAISVHELLYGTTSGVNYPVTIYNFTNEKNLPVKIKVADKADSSKIIFEKEDTFTVEQGSSLTKTFNLAIPAGSYIANVTLSGISATTQLGIESSSGTATLKEVDLNNDGINEYNMENDHVQVTLLTTGARVIEYIVKAKKDNILFKLWPEKPIDDRRPYRTREFYPYGGFEDFLGQPSIETHKVYDAEIVKNEGEYVQVKMRAEFYGNIIEKIFTLYGNSPLLEIRFALTMINPEMNMLGPQPILEIGKTHGPEDKFIIPEMDGLHEYTMRTDRYFGRAFFIQEGWNAGQDTKEDIAFAGAFPVKQPIFLHMWMNHPSNPGSHYYYAEFQPWTPLFRQTTTYFSYYMWAAPGSWEQSVKALRDRNLITVR